MCDLYVSLHFTCVLVKAMLVARQPKAPSAEKQWILF